MEGGIILPTRFFSGRGSNPVPYIYYTLSISTELNSRELFPTLFKKEVNEPG